MGILFDAGWGGVSQGGVGGGSGGQVCFGFCCLLFRVACRRIHFFIPSLFFAVTVRVGGVQTVVLVFFFGAICFSFVCCSGSMGAGFVSCCGGVLVVIVFWHCFAVLWSAATKGNGGGYGGSAEAVRDGWARFWGGEGKARERVCLCVCWCGKTTVIFLVWCVQHRQAACVWGVCVCVVAFCETQNTSMSFASVFAGTRGIAI